MHNLHVGAAQPAAALTCLSWVCVCERLTDLQQWSSVEWLQALKGCVTSPHTLANSTGQEAPCSRATFFLTYNPFTVQDAGPINPWTDMERDRNADQGKLKDLARTIFPSIAINTILPQIDVFLPFYRVLLNSSDSTMNRTELGAVLNAWYCPSLQRFAESRLWNSTVQCDGFINYITMQQVRDDGLHSVTDLYQDAVNQLLAAESEFQSQAPHTLSFGFDSTHDELTLSVSPASAATVSQAAGSNNAFLRHDEL